MKPNAMKAKLLAGEPALGCSVMIPSPHVVEMLGALGFDWVLIDCEHGTISLESVELMAMAADAAGITAIARPPTNRHEDISRMMDRGVGGVQVPHVNTAEDARRAVSAVRFGPGALRGLAAGTRAESYGYGPGGQAAFAEASNAESLVIVQLEHEEAIRNADAIIAVEGVDVFFIGPSDLSQSMGHPGEPGAAPVRAAIEATLAKIRAAGRIAGHPASAGTVQGVIEAGALYIYTHVPRLLEAGAKGFLNAARPA